MKRKADTFLNRSTPIFELTREVSAAIALIREHSPLQGASEDLSFYAQATPGMFVFLGITPQGQDPATAAPNNSPNFYVDEGALVVGARAMSSMALAYLTGPGLKPSGAQQ